MPQRRLKTNLDVRRYLANLINRAESEEVEIQKAGRLAYIVQILLKALESGELEKRVEALEKVIGKQEEREKAPVLRFQERRV